jgi:hypothetical protein
MDSSVAITTGWTAWFRFPARGKRFFSSPQRPDRLWGPTQRTNQWVPEAFLLEVQRPGREADHSPPCSAMSRTVKLYTSNSPYAFLEWCLINHGQLYVFCCCTVCVQNTVLGIVSHE